MLDTKFARLELANRKNEIQKVLQNAFAGMGMSTEALADYCGVSHSTITKIKKGIIEGISFDKMYLIAISLGFSVNVKVVNVNQ